MPLDQLVHFAKDRSRFDSKIRVSFSLLVKLLAKCSDSLRSNWNCLVVPQQELCDTIRLQTNLRTDCQGKFTALLITQKQTSTRTFRGQSWKKDSMELADWLVRLIYTAQGMDLLVKPLFHFDLSILEHTLHLESSEKIRLVVLLGYPEHSDTTSYMSPQIRFYTRRR